jgi:hypothetical protein
MEKENLWFPPNPRDPLIVPPEVEEIWTNTAYALADCGVDTRILDEIYEMAKLYTDNYEAFSQRRDQFLTFFENYISNEENKASLTKSVSEMIKDCNKFPLEITCKLGFDFE